MAKRAYNSTLPETLRFRGEIYPSPTQLYRSVSPPPIISLASFRHRLWRRAKTTVLTKEVLEEALYTSTSDYKKRYATRKSLVAIDGRRFALEDFYRQEQQRAEVSYRNLWQRAKRLGVAEMLDSESLEDALTLPASEWKSFYGGGRARRFTYTGELYPEHSGRKFHSIAAFLRTVSRYHDRAQVWARCQRGWDLDDALSIPVDAEKDRTGLVYEIARTSTEQIYVGLTRSSLENRWRFHVSAARGGSTAPIAQAIREDSSSGFVLRILEDGIETSDELKQREGHWTAALGALGPKGLNVAKPGSIGGSNGIATEFQGEAFPSLAEATRVLGDRHGLAPHVVAKRLRSGSPLPVKARTHSKHPDAGSNLFRRWLSLKKRHKDDIDSVWIDSFDAFKAEVGTEYELSWKLLRVDQNSPWGPGNWRWGSSTEMVETTHGQGIVIEGITYPSYAAAARAYGIGVSTFKNRILVQGLSPKEAANKALGKTSFRRAGGAYRADGQEFRSMCQVRQYFATKYGLTEGQAKYRLEKGDFELGLSADR